MKQWIKSIILACGTILLAVLLISFPKEALNASTHGLNLWWKIVFPSLLPFFIISELLIGFGVVRFIGILFEPIMRPIFNVPGAGSFAWIMGMASGYPSGAKITTRLREEKQITQIEAERLLSFTNNSSPLFIFGAVAVGILHDADLGLFIAICHYGGNAIVGFCMRFYGQTKKNHKKEKKPKTSFITALSEMHKARIKDPRPFGKVLGDAVINSIQTLIMVGGFIILFSVFSRLLLVTGISDLIASVLKYGLLLFALPIEFGIPLFSGLFEITLGINMIYEAMQDSMLEKLILINFVLGFNGLSVQAQVSSIIAKTDIRFAPYFFSRLLHGCFASILTVLLFKPLYLSRKTFLVEDIPVVQDATTSYWVAILQKLSQTGPLITITCIGLSILLLLKRKLQDY